MKSRELERGVNESKQWIDFNRSKAKSWLVQYIRFGCHHPLDFLLGEDAADLTCTSQKKVTNRIY